MEKFKLEEKFVEQYSKKQVNFGFNGLGEITYLRTYSRLKPDGNNEKWFETVERVVNGIYSIQKEHILKQDLGWNESKAQKSAQEMYERIFTFKFLPPGRGLWAAGTSIIEKGLGAALNNCGFVSTKDIDKDFSKPFTFMMDMSMLGVGVGFDVKGASKIIINKPFKEAYTYTIPDTREGWVESLRLLLNSYNNETKQIINFDYSLIRKAGEPIKTFGGISSGAEPLIKLHQQLKNILDELNGKLITERAIADIMNLIGVCVVSGNVRRSAQIMFGDISSNEYLDLKNYKVNPERANYGWTSNNSVFCDLNTDYTEAAIRTGINGEPGYFWLENAQKYGRIVDGVNWKDKKAVGCNPCAEQTLENFELCCVTGDTRIMTSTGFPKIQDVVGKKIKIWNGKNWSIVEPFETGKNKEIFRVHISDGSYLDVTSNHNWSAKRKTERIFKKISTSCLEEGMILENFEFNNSYEGIRFENAYSAGWVCGDGFIDGNRVMGLVQSTEYGVFNKLVGTVYKEQHPKEYKNPFSRINLTKSVGLSLGKELRDKNKGLPEEIFSWDKYSLAEFFGGWIDTDGTVRRQLNTDSYVLCSSNEQKLRDAQILLRRLGVNHSTIGQWREIGESTNYSESSLGLWALYIPSYECNNINTFLKKAYRIGSRLKKNNAHKNSKLIDSAVNQKIVKIEKLQERQTTYCFTEPERGMGVFGNCLTYQCLVETFPANHNNLEDYKRTLKFAYLYGKSVTLVKTHNKDTNKVLLKNRRIGLSQTGIAQFLENNTLETYRVWCDEGYKTVQHYDEVYSNWFCIPKSVKTTSIKPSGSISLLAGATPGMHYPENDYYIRRIRIAKNSDLLKACEEAGYFTEEDVYDSSSMVVEIPVEVKCRTVDKVSIWEQVSLASFIQKWWADNQVSCTVTFKLEEAKEIPSILNYFKYDLKAISFLPKTEKGAYKQMPYEAITKEKYEDLVKNIKPLSVNSLQQDSKPELYCDSSSCEIK